MSLEQIGYRLNTLTIDRRDWLSLEQIGYRWNWLAIHFCRQNSNIKHFCYNFFNLAFLSREFINTRSTTAFKDLLESTIVLQITPPLYFRQERKNVVKKKLLSTAPLRPRELHHKYILLLSGKLKSPSLKNVKKKKFCHLKSMHMSPLIYFEINKFWAIMIYFVIAVIQVFCVCPFWLPGGFRAKWES